MIQKKRLGKRLLASVMSAAVLTAAASSQLSWQPNMTATAADYDYGTALELGLYFFDANECGGEVDDNCLTWRGNCHMQDATASLDNAQGLSSASKSAIMAQNGGSSTVDVSGGYHDAGDHIKFSMTQGFAMTSLAWSYYSYPDSYDETGATDHLLHILRKSCDYFMKVTYLDDSGNVICGLGQVASEGEDHSTWTVPEDQTMTRTTYWFDASNPMADASGQMAASLASASIVFRQKGDTAYADECLKYAQALSEFTTKYNSTKNLGRGSMYSSTSQKDDAAWAELWVALAEGGGTLPSSYTPTYQLTSQGQYGSESDYWMYCWDKVWGGYAALLCEVGYDSSKYAQELIFEVNNSGGLSTSSYNTKGWGTSRHNCALQMQYMHAYMYNNDSSIPAACKYQMDNILGSNSYGYSFVIGYGDTWPVHIHHRAATADNGDSKTNPEMAHVLYGAMVGGVDSSGYQDHTDQYQYTEPALDYNGCFALAIAALYDVYGGSTDGADAIASAASEITYPYDFGGGTTVTPPDTSETTEPTSEPDVTETTEPETTETTEPPTEPPTTESDANVTKQDGNVWVIDVTDAQKAIITANMAANTGTNGCIGYTGSSGWTQENWTGNADGSGKYVYEFTVPEGVTSIQFQVWWPNEVNSVTAVLVKAAEETEPAPTESDSSEDTTNVTGEIVYGDVNGDGKVTIVDVIMLNKGLMGAEELDDTARTNGDVDLSGQLTNGDSLNILKSLVKLVTLPIN